ncbi:MAG TPA: tyrosine--tRNA ligase [Microthrixaceae bacterium]|nr:tyrosine--tRNA ligase [Microthrixaceae bacterium]
MPSAALLDDLDARGLVHDSTDRSGLAERLAAGPITLYCGLDPTAPSLHLGNLQQLLLLRRFQLAGHRPIALAGGATGLIGDPGGRSDERQLLAVERVAANVESISVQMAKMLDFEPGPTQARLVNNLDWTASMTTIEFLRDVGKHMTVNVMLAKDSVRGRIEREAGISFTEFSYMLLQANDFRVLYEREGCELQVAGSDQWGNITAGIELIRRSVGASVHGLTSPLLLRSDGSKFGKSVDGSIWLDPELTSPFQFFQFFMQVSDEELERLFLRFTLLPIDETREVLADHAAAPHLRRGHRRLAAEVTALVHGPDVLPPIEAATDVLFGGGDVTAASQAAFELLAAEVPSTRVSREEVTGAGAVEWVAATPLADSKGVVRRDLKGYSVNGQRLDEHPTIEPSDWLHGRYVLLRRGRATHHLLVADPG